MASSVAAPAEASCTPWSEQFTPALKKARHQAKEVKKLHSTLQDPMLNDKDVLRAKLEYVSVQLGFYDTIIATLTAQNAYYQREVNAEEDDNSSDTEEETYHVMVDILNELEKGFSRILCTPDSTFLMFWKMAKSWIERNKWKALAAVPIAGVVGAGLVDIIQVTSGYCLFGMGGSVACGCLTPTTALIHSALWGSLIVVVILLFCYMVYQYFHQLGSYEVEKKKQLEKLVEGIQKMNKGEAPKAFRELLKLTQQWFACFDPAVSDRCPVCLDDIDPTDAERAPLCRGPHFLHSQCWAQYVQSSNDQRCPICRT